MKSLPWLVRGLKVIAEAVAFNDVCPLSSEAEPRDTSYYLLGELDAVTRSTREMMPPRARVGVNGLLYSHNGPLIDWDASWHVP